MIGRIRGIILEKQSPELVIDVHGVGYELQAPLSTFYKLPAPGQEVVLYTHFVVREDAQQLYGFWQREDRSLVWAELAAIRLAAARAGEPAWRGQENRRAADCRDP